MDKEVKEVLAFEKIVIDYINKGYYLSAYLLLQERLQEQNRTDKDLGIKKEDKRTEIP